MLSMGGGGMAVPLCMKRSRDMRGGAGKGKRRGG